MARLGIQAGFTLMLLLKLVVGGNVQADASSCEQLDIVLKAPNCFSRVKWKLKAKIFCQISVQSYSSRNFWLKKNSSGDEILSLTQPCNFGSSDGFKNASFVCCYRAPDKNASAAMEKKTKESPITSNKSVPKLLLKSREADDGRASIIGRSVIRLTSIERGNKSKDPPTNPPTKMKSSTKTILLTEEQSESVPPLGKTNDQRKCNMGLVVGLYKSSIPKQKALCEYYTSYLEDLGDTEKWHVSSIESLKSQLREGKKRYLVLKAQNVTLAQMRLDRSLGIWQETLRSIESEYEQGQKRLNVKHHTCVLSQFSNTKGKLMQSFVAWIQEGGMLHKHPIGDIGDSISKVIQEMMLLIGEVKRYHSSLFTTTYSAKDMYKPAHINIASYEMMVNKSLELVRCMPELLIEPTHLKENFLPQSMAGLSELTRYGVIKVLFDLGVRSKSHNNHADIMKILKNFDEYSRTNEVEILTIPKPTEIFTPDASFVGSGESEKYTEGSGSIPTYSGDNDNYEKDDNEYSGDNEESSSGEKEKYEITYSSSRIPKKRRIKEIIITRNKEVRRVEKIKSELSFPATSTVITEHVFLTTESTPQLSLSSKLASAVRQMLADFPQEKKGCDLSLYDIKEQDIRSKYQTRIFSVVKEWNKAQERYTRLSQKDERKAERFLLKTLASSTREMNGAKQSREVKSEETRRNRAECLNKHILKSQRDALVKFTESIQDSGPLDLKKVTGHLANFISSCQHLRVYKMQFNKDSEVYTVRYKIKEHIKELNQVIKRVTALLEHLPNAEDAAAIKRQVWLLQINFTFETLTSL